jgi:hypothetical protein
LLLFGLLTRFAAVPMMIVMLVAIMAAKASQIDRSRRCSLRGGLLLRHVRLARRRSWPDFARSSGAQGSPPERPAAEYGA